ncbi:uncharacterized protein ACHE_60920A [Aspergillus chevalieri]|uniref:Uncharacterized protein n=1 Tax=Aspergillus chevalieri TaxID=182096 RepID=A0A7R7VUI3_ASPCH|nr:uncharacterized protein ACHE_60920A [Aspergillus chevalieri]BCR91034.1 hypothetical protein ACHE_60920A [Aspergillus chevalieri]
MPADEQAKKGARSTLQTNPPPARYAWASRTLKEEFWRRFQAFWADNAPQQYQDLSIGLDKRPTNYPFPEPPSVVSLPPGRAMETSSTIMSASDMKTPSWSARADAQRPPITSTTAGRATRHPHSHGEADKWMRFCALGHEQGIL